MTNPAAERLRRCQMKCGGFVHADEKQWIRDTCEVLNAYLSEHLPDDGELWDEAWLSKVLGDEESSRLIISVDGVGWLVLDFDTGHRVRIPDHSIRTRGQLRLLLRALGVEGEGE